MRIGRDEQGKFVKRRGARRRFDGRGHRHRWRSICGRPHEVAAERTYLIVLADLVGTIEDRA